MSIISFNFSNSVKRVNRFTLFYRWEKWGHCRTNNLPKVRQLSGKPRFKSLPAYLQDTRHFTWEHEVEVHFHLWLAWKFSVMQLWKLSARCGASGLWGRQSACCPEGQTVAWQNGAETLWPVAAWQVWWMAFIWERVLLNKGGAAIEGASVSYL